MRLANTWPQQTMYRVMQFIVTLYDAGPVRDRYKKAAEGFRVPYWDWAASTPSGSSVLPSSIGGSPNIWADGPNGRQFIGNPLFSYTFKPLNRTAFVDFPVSRDCRPGLMLEI